MAFVVSLAVLARPRCCALVERDGDCAAGRGAALVWRAAGGDFLPPQARRPISVSPASQVLVMHPPGGGDHV